MRNTYIQVEILLCLLDCQRHTLLEIQNKIGYGKETIRRHVQDLSILLPIEMYRGGMKGQQGGGGIRLQKNYLLKALFKTSEIELLLQGLEICCIDLDGCLDENGEYSALAKETMNKCGKTYMELSLSKKGLHIFGKTKGMGVRSFSKDGDMEFYQSGRFISMTGDGTAYSQLESLDRYEVKSLIERKFDKRTELKGQGQGVAGLSTMTDRDVVEKACADKKYGAKFKALYDGKDLQNNHSNSDMSLMNRLAFWCNGDKEQMLRIFATSGLYRPEKSDAYYEGTAIKAVRDTISRYTSSKPTPKAPKPVNTSGKGGK